MARPWPVRSNGQVAAKEVIDELRQKLASYRSIAELLAEHCLPASKTGVAGFCHQVLGEIVALADARKGSIRYVNMAMNNRLVTVSHPNIVEVWDRNETEMPSTVNKDCARLLSGRSLNAAGAVLTIKTAELTALMHSLKRSARNLFVQPPNDRSTSPSE